MSQQICRAKFTVNSIQRVIQKNYATQQDQEVHNIELMPVYGNSDENKKFFASTPSGSIKLGIVNPEAAKFELNKSYYVDFTLAE